MLRASEMINDEEPAIINYCDFYMTWNWANMKSAILARGCEGCVPCYTGFRSQPLIYRLRVRFAYFAVPSLPSPLAPILPYEGFSRCFVNNSFIVPYLPAQKRARRRTSHSATRPEPQRPAMRGAEQVCISALYTITTVLVNNAGKSYPSQMRSKSMVCPIGTTRSIPFTPDRISGRSILLSPIYPIVWHLLSLHNGIRSRISVQLYS